MQLFWTPFRVGTCHIKAEKFSLKHFVLFQTLLQYAGTRGASEHILPFLEVYRISIQSFANARPYLTTECEDVLLVLGRLVL